MKTVQEYLNPQVGVLARVRNGLLLLVFVFVAAGLFFSLDVLFCWALVHSGVNVALAINAGLVVGIAGCWILILKIPYIKVPNFLNGKYVAPLLLTMVVAGGDIYVSVDLLPPITPPRHTSFAD